jgi:signal transduction histidine kinase
VHRLRPRFSLLVDALTFVVAVVGVLEALTTPRAGPLGVRLAYVAAYTLPLLAWRRFPAAAPLAVVGVVVVASIADRQLVERQGVGALAIGIAIGILAAGQPLRPLVAGLAGTALVVAVVVVGHHPWYAVPSNLAFFGFVAAAVRLVATHRERARQAEETRDAHTRAAVAAERTRIARDLHDVVSTGLVVIATQAGAARTLADPSSPTYPMLRRIEETARDALGDMRRMLGVIGEGVEAERTPPPTAADVADLVARMRAAGLPVELRVDGEPPHAAGLEVAVYRILQEALANALRHAAAHRVDVRLAYAVDGIAIDVENDGAGARRPNGSGMGLANIRERAALHGGDVRVERSGDRFALHVTLPAGS